MKNLIILILIVFTQFSCKRDDGVICQYNKDGELISKNYLGNGKFLDSVIYFKKGIVDAKIYFKNHQKLNCYVKYYDSHGRLTYEGNTYNKMKVGKWKYYDDENRKCKVVEFKNICNKEYPNQEWNYDYMGKLKMDFCTFFTYKIEKARIIEGVKVNDLKIHFTPMFKNGSVCKINFSPEIDSNFCNVDAVQKYTLNSDNSYVFTIPLKSEDIGENNFTGYIEETYDESTNKEDFVNHRVRRVYIDIPIFVK